MINMKNFAGGVSSLTLASLASLSVATVTAQNAHAQQASDSLGMQYDLMIGEPATLTFENDIVVTPSSTGGASGSTDGCIGDIEPNFDVSISGAHTPDGTNGFYFLARDDTYQIEAYLRYNVKFTMAFNPSFYLWQSSLNNGDTYTVKESLDEEFVGGCEVGYSTKLRIQALEFRPASAESSTLSHVYQDVYSAYNDLPEGDYLFRDTLTITLSPALGTS